MCLLSAALCDVSGTTRARSVMVTAGASAAGASAMRSVRKTRSSDTAETTASATTTTATITKANSAAVRHCKNN